MKHRESEQTQLRVSRLLNRDSVMLHAEMPSVQTALETLVELQESNGVITNGTAYYKAVCERERAGGKGLPSRMPAMRALPRLGWPR